MRAEQESQELDDRRSITANFFIIQALKNHGYIEALNKDTRIAEMRSLNQSFTCELSLVTR